MNQTHANNKQRIFEYLNAVASANQSPEAMRAYFHDDIVWRGCAPFETQHGIDALWRAVWQPLLRSFSALRRRVDILLGGECEGEDWVASAGYIIGNFERDWLGIAQTGRETFIRFGEFYQLTDGKIVKAFVILDLIEVMQQAGCDPLPPSLGISGFAPPPRAADGILLAEQAPAESQKTFQIACDMLFQGMNSFDQERKESMGFPRYWHDNMHWFGPAGIGTTRDLKEFEDNHQLPWLRAFPDRQVVWESPMFGDGHYAATAGWREVIATHTGPFLGHPASGNSIECRVMDFWRREGDLLSENWVLIDIIDMFRQFGTDLLARLPGRLST